MKGKYILITVALVVLLVLGAGLSAAQGPNLRPQDFVQEVPLGSEFTYQGRLKDNGNPVEDTCDFTFGLWDADTNGIQIGSDSAVSGVLVTDGFFAAQVNSGSEFGASAFAGAARWLEIAVKCSGDTGYTTLSLRQALTGTPYALSLQPGTTISGTIAIGSVLTGRNSGSTGVGLYGLSAATDGGGIGVVGESTGSVGAGVWGVASATSGTTYGVYGLSSSGDGRGVYGLASATSGITYGV